MREGRLMMGGGVVRGGRGGGEGTALMIGMLHLVVSLCVEIWSASPSESTPPSRPSGFLSGVVGAYVFGAVDLNLSCARIAPVRTVWGSRMHPRTRPAILLHQSFSSPIPAASCSLPQRSLSKSS